MELLIKLLGIVCPVILFLFKYILPAQFEKVFSKKKRERKQIIIELIHFPNELLMVSVGYTIPKTIEYIQFLSVNAQPEQALVFDLLYNIIFSIIIIGALPFCIAQTKVIENCYFSGYHKKVWKDSIILYVICIIIIIVSLILGV